MIIYKNQIKINCAKNQYIIVESPQMYLNRYIFQFQNLESLIYVTCSKLPKGKKLLHIKHILCSYQLISFIVFLKKITIKLNPKAVKIMISFINFNHYIMDIYFSWTDHKVEIHWRKHKMTS